MDKDSTFFQISSPRDMLEKAKREFSRMKLNLDTDTIFNFFVTAYHVMDHVEALDTINRTSIQQMYDDEDFKMCNFICNKGKHAILTKVTPYNSHSDGPPGGEVIHTVRTPDKSVRVEELAQRLMIKWEKFFADNGI